MNSKICTSIEQSKKLIELGIDMNTADMMWTALNWQETEYYMEVKNKGFDMPKKYIPAWSLAALRNILPVGIEINENAYLFESHNTFDNSWVYRYYNEDDTSYLYYKNTSEINACVEMIIKLHELKML